MRHPFAFSLWTLANLVAGVGAASPAVAATQSAPITANAIKPLVLTKLQDLDFGSVTLGPGVWSNAAVSVTQTGAFSCANVNLFCTGVTSVAMYNAQGSNNQTVRISAPNVTLVNQSDSTKTLTLVTDAPATVLLTSSGHPGNNFSVGGRITLSSSTAAGTYVGTFNVTVDY